MEDGQYDIAVIGGGIIGLATARALVRKHAGLDVAVVEKEAEVGLHQTGHNSGVVHAGIYYAPGSQKAGFCWTGSTKLRRYCDGRSIPYKMCGKLIVAIDESELPALEELNRRGVANGVEGLEMVDRERLREIEPHAAGIRALHSPNTGIVDYGDITSAFVEDIADGGGEVIRGGEVTDIAVSDGNAHLRTARGEVKARHVVNCAGLHADTVARMMGVEPGLRIVPFRGEYYSLAPERSGLVKGLIYPTPDPEMPFLGVHLTKRTDGTVEAGPNAVLALAREGYRKTDVDLAEMARLLAFPGFWRMALANWKTAMREEYRSMIKSVFARSMQRLVPEITVEDLHEPGAGIRAQAVSPKGELIQDFRIVQTATSIHVLNAPSPGATSCLAIADHIVGLAQEAFGLESPKGVKS